MKRLFALASILGLLLLGLPAVASAGGSPTALELILDSSGSMAAKDPSGVTKLDAAKQALRGVIGGLPDGATVGLRVYGARYTDKSAGCTDTQLVLPLAPLDRAKATAALATFSPTGQTPIAYSLRQAAKDLPAAGQRTIVLVSDGEETCSPTPPCEVAKELAGQGIDLHVDTVGFQVNDAARQQLLCIAQETGGHYYDAPDAAVLSTALARVANRAFRPYLAGGAFVRGTPSPAGAPTLLPGQYVDTLRNQEKKFYTVDLKAGVTPYFAATVARPIGKVIPPGGNSTDYLSFNDSVTIDIGTSTGVDCGSRENGTYQGSLVGPASVTAVTPVIGAHWQGHFSGPYSDRTCGQPGKYVITVTRDQGSTQGIGDAALPLEILFLAEPPVAGDVAAMPVPLPTSSASPLVPDVTAAAHPVTGGGSFASAGLLGGSGTFTDTIRSGESLFYRVQLDWGQRIAYTVHFRETSSSGTGSASVRSELLSPAREEIKGTDDSGSYSADSGDSTAGETLTPVAYRNRESDDDAVSPLRLAGSYYLLVQMSDEDGLRNLDIPVEIAVEVQGQPQAGPAYRQIKGAIDPKAVGEPGAAPVGEHRSATSGGLPMRKVAYVTGGGVAVALAALLLVPLIRRRRMG